MTYCNALNKGRSHACCLKPGHDGKHCDVRDSDGGYVYWTVCAPRGGTMNGDLAAADDVVDAEIQPYTEAPEPSYMHGYADGYKAAMGASRVAGILHGT